MEWLFVEEVATLYGLTPRAIRERVYQGYFGALEKSYRFVYGKGRGGKTLQIALESLDATAQARYRHEEPAPEPIEQYTGKQREEANFRAQVVAEYHQSGLSPDAFVEDFNGRNPEDAITRSKLFRWQRQYKAGEVAALIDRRGGHNRGSSSIPAEAWDYFYSLYMTQQKRSVRLCYDETKKVFPNIPSVSAFDRKATQIPQYALIYYREGPKKFADSLPSMERSRLDIHSNDIWFSDHHLCDVFVKSQDGRHAVRSWLTVFFDARSNKVVSSLVRLASPNATAIKQCLRMGIEQQGVPFEVYFDNGEDYRSKSFSKDYPLSLVNQLGIKTIYATAYHGQAKTVERFFRTFCDQFCKRFPTYTGKDAKNRPECMRTSDKEIIELAPTLEEFSAAVAAYIETEYNNKPSRGIDMDNKSPNQVYAENLIEKRVIRDQDALRLLCGNSEERVVHKNGVSILNNNYFAEQLLHYLGKRVIVTFDPTNINKVAVFDMKNRAICMAEAKVRTPFRKTTEEDYKRAAKEKKAARAIVKRYAPSRDLDIHSIIARNQAMEKAFEETGKPRTVEFITPQAMRNAEILKNSDQPTSARRLREEESVSATLMKLYQQEDKEALG